MSVRTRTATRRAVPVAALLVGGALALAALSLLAPSIPSYDPFAWLVWGRELVTAGQTFGLDGGPSWKPLPVLFTAPFSLLADGAAPDLWLLVVRTGALLALAGAYALGARLAGMWAGLVAAAGVLLADELASLAWRGASEPLLLACVLWAVERHLAGRRGTAFWLGVVAALIRPEAWPFLGLYALWRWRTVDRRERVLMAGGLLLVPLLWFGPPGLTGDPFAASTHATNYDGQTGSDPAWTALRRGLGLVLAPIWVVAGAALALRPRDRVVRGLALGALAWLLLVVAMTVAGYPGLARFMLPAAAIACVLAGVGAVELARRAAGRGSAAVGALAVIALLAVGAGFALAPARGDVRELRGAVDAAQLQHGLTRAIDAAGGRARVLACGAVAVNHTAQTALAWKLRVSLDRVALQLTRAGVVFRGPRSDALGSPPPLALARPWRKLLLAHVERWYVKAVLPAAAPLPHGCGPRS
ncbi:MAG TPA: hypothetical protein VN635_02990 [Conexibacter sp.]|nr:hypothetical protein [Conexibacter sp.]